jgi:hypothetical protein
MGEFGPNRQGSTSRVGADLARASRHLFDLVAMAGGGVVLVRDRQRLLVRMY